MIDKFFQNYKIANKISQLVRSVENNPDHFSDESYGEIYKLSCSIQNAFKHDDILCIYTENKSVIAATVIAALRCGFKIVLPYSLTEKTVDEIYRDINFTSLLVDSDYKGTKKYQTFCPSIDDNKANSEISFSMYSNINDSFLFLYTGGSTGKPSCFVKSIKNIFSEAYFLVKCFSLSSSNNYISTVPPYHIYGFLFSIILPMITLARTEKENPKFPENIFNFINSNNDVVLISTPIHYKLINNSTFSSGNVNKAFSSAAPLSEKISLNLYNRTGLKINEIFGSTETGGIATKCRATGEIEWRPFGIVKWGIDDTCLKVKSPFISADLIRDRKGYYKTNDHIKVIKGSNTFSLIGRKDSVVKIGGKRIDIKQVQEKINAIELVESSYVLTLPSFEGKDFILGCVVAGKTTLNKLKNSMRDIFEPHEIPKKIVLTKELPYSSTGKISREAVLKMFQ